MECVGKRSATGLWAGANDAISIGSRPVSKAVSRCACHRASYLSREVAIAAHKPLLTKRAIGASTAGRELAFLGFHSVVLSDFTMGTERVAGLQISAL